jgi:alpha-tubulin suppressor-like RCC1 family protein
VPDKPSFIQNTPRPVASLRAKPLSRSVHSQYVCKSVAAGSRHTVFLMINCRKEREEGKRRAKKLFITGLNQVALCEESGSHTPIELEWNYDMERPMKLAAGRGTTFVLSKTGALYSCGHGKFGVLGHGNCESIQHPLKIKALSREYITNVSAGSAHAIALTREGVLFSWGKNDKGQLGRGLDVFQDLKPGEVTFPSIGNGKYSIVDISCGHDHCLILAGVVGRGGDTANLVYAWGDHSRGQLGSGDEQGRNLPQENRWMTRFCKNEGISIGKIAAGGFHNLALLENSGQIISWGAGDYGQLGHGDQYDDPAPKIINKIKDVTAIAAGLRHSMAIVEGTSLDVMGW